MQVLLQQVQLWWLLEPRRVLEQSWLQVLRPEQRPGRRPHGLR